jgi:asparagine synthase (glutamine-hydrolysing)
MCGIAGFVDFSGHDREGARRRVQRMTDAIPHRGPDADGFFVDQQVALGHRRLSIIDLASGHQPMAAADGKVQIAFNGEIYNFQTLRKELQSLGHSFATRSDTEVILHAYLEWGDACLERLDGMFAFALWDARSRRLLVARDRVGEKPLYWTAESGTFAFGSELKALRAGGACSDDIDPEALDAYFTLGYIPSPRTIWRGAKKLRPAHAMSVTEQGVREWCYWKLSFADPRPIGLDEAADELGSLLDEAVRSRMVSDVPLGAFLSGGLDSSLVVESMSRQSNRSVITNSIGFAEREFNELDVARVTAARLGTDHHEEVIRPQAAEILPRIAWHFDEPLADSSAVPTWYVCAMARRQVTVALSGDGGDEAFGGYTFRYLPHAHESRIRARVPAALRSAVFGSAAALWPASARLPRPLRLKTILGNLGQGDAEAFYRDLAFLRDETRRQVYQHDFLKRLGGFSARETVYPHYNGSDAPDAVGRAQHTDIQLYMTDDVLAKVDRLSMAHSLEVRCPLLDPAILELGARLPASVRMSGGRGKMPLRRLAERRLPREVIEMPKKGFSIPAARWLREDLRPMTERLLFETESPLREWLDPGALRRTWDEHLSGNRDHSVFVWGAMMFCLWHQALDKPAPVVERQQPVTLGTF